jgi:formate dehydrogenase subunit gamma
VQASVGQGKGISTCSECGPKNPPARKFNTGQKLVFWSVAIGGLALTLTGVGLMFPFFWDGYTGMQIAQSLHAVLALLMIGLIIATSISAP